MNTEDQELIAEAMLGNEAVEFLKSELWKYMAGVAEQEVQVALQALSTVDPIDTEAVRKLQNKVKMYSDFEEWLAELVSKGNDAIEAYKQTRDEQ